MTIHQVLHFLDNPGGAIKEAASALAVGGRLLIVDFAPHTLDFLQSEHAHRWLGLSDAQVSEWLRQAGLRSVSKKQLEPAGDAENMLTVSLWLARK